MSASYRKITGPKGHLALLEPFQGKSMHAQWEENGSRYVVYSYSSPIFDVSYNCVGEIPSRGSVTTSKHRNYCRAWLGHAKRL